MRSLIVRLLVHGSALLSEAADRISPNDGSALRARVALVCVELGYRAKQADFDAEAVVSEGARARYRTRVEAFDEARYLVEGALTAGRAGGSHDAPR